MTNEIRELGSIRLELFSMIKSQVTFSDFCQPAGTIEFIAYQGFLQNSIQLFSISYKNFIFKAKVDNGRVLIFRNGLHRYSEQYLGHDPCHVALQWDISSIGCGIVPLKSDSDMNKHLYATRTPITTPPTDMVNILRKENLLSNNKYENMDVFFTTVIDSLHCIQEDIRRHGAERLFWKKNSQNIWKPIDEPDISRGIAAFLNVYGALKNFDVVCESVAGLGSVDFYVVAPVGENIGKIIIEAKKANSNDLTKGFTKQLPNYMQRINTEYGIYLVYWLKSLDYPYPKKYNKYGELEIELLHPIPRQNTIRTLGINLSKEANPSSE